jgi:hypothetical protein
LTYETGIFVRPAEKKKCPKTGWPCMVIRIYGRQFVVTIGEAHELRRRIGWYYERLNVHIHGKAVRLRHSADARALCHDIINVVTEIIVPPRMRSGAVDVFKQNRRRT